MSGCEVRASLSQADDDVKVTNVTLAARGETPAAFGRRCIPPPPQRGCRVGGPGWLRCSSFKYSRYCTPPCTRRTVGTPLCARRAAPPGSPRRGLCAVGWNGRAHRRPRCGAGVQCGPHEEIDDVLPALIHERGDGPSGEVIKPSANEGEAEDRQVVDRR